MQLKGRGDGERMGEQEKITEKRIEGGVTNKGEENK